MSRTIRFTSHKAVEDAYTALLLLAHLTKEEEHYRDVILALRDHEREQRETIVLLTNSKLDKDLASGILQDMDTAYPTETVPR